MGSTPDVGLVGAERPCARQSRQWLTGFWCGSRPFCWLPQHHGHYSRSWVGWEAEGWVPSRDRRHMFVNQLHYALFRWCRSSRAAAWRTIELERVTVITLVELLCDEPGV
ncbi:uncharacterized protein [Triticum aestivum]|uniref:uncharacterized protein isoform X1 n=1 Tax=Triticum aestivum TaxID=4565 RepID=UPI001D028FC6|nr:uncharacterized protein LOC123064642 isoform X1 [Triticum aestivum]